MQSKREIVRIEPERIIPDPAAVLRSLGGSPTAREDERVGSLIRRAQDLLVARAVPVGIFAEVNVKEFRSIYRGEGLNEPRTPLDGIFPRADHLALL
ncbi:MAG: hypothetical protein KAY24_15200, partial [Candidatus Eisenbacteria sp.]|nr:hypothetical protein [Candidatus Eisenbacteria bacterium]